MNYDLFFLILRFRDLNYLHFIIVSVFLVKFLKKYVSVKQDTTKVGTTMKILEGRNQMCPEIKFSRL